MAETIAIKLAEKVKQMRALQKKRDSYISFGNKIPREDWMKLVRLQREVDDLLLLVKN